MAAPSAGSIPHGYSEGSRQAAAGAAPGRPAAGARRPSHRSAAEQGGASPGLCALTKGDWLKPREMPEGRVRAFVTGVTVTPTPPP